MHNSSIKCKTIAGNKEPRTFSRHFHDIFNGTKWMSPTRGFLNMIILFSLMMTVSSCKKQYETCTWENETTAMSVYLREKTDSSGYEMKEGTIDYSDTLKFYMTAIVLNFNLDLISNYTCSTPTDSVIGHIRDIICVSNYYCGNDTVKDTINDRITVRIQYLNREEFSSNAVTISAIQPRCEANIYLYLNAPTDTSCLQSFTVHYSETDGSEFSATSKPIYITP